MNFYNYKNKTPHSTKDKRVYKRIPVLMTPKRSKTRQPKKLVVFNPNFLLKMRLKMKSKSCKSKISFKTKPFYSRSKLTCLISNKLMKIALKMSRRLGKIY